MAEYIKMLQGSNLVKSYFFCDFKILTKRMECINFEY